MCGSARGGGEADHHHLHDPRLLFDAATPPSLEVVPGQIFTVETADALGGRITRPDHLIQSIDALIEELGGLNYVTGPIAVRGVRPGDVMRVSILDIDPAPDTGRGFIAVTPGFGALVGDGGRGVGGSLRPSTTICEVSRAEIAIPFAAGTARIPCRPFVGTIGVAPTYERRMTLSQSADHLGDLDIPDLGAGATIHVRANHEGGLLSLGDVHAAQGDGEVGGIAVEIAARVTLRIEITSREDTTYRRLPWLVDADRVGVVAAFGGLPSSLCVRSAAVELCEMLVRQGMSAGEAIQYLSAAMRVRLGNMFEPFYSAYAYLERPTLPVALPGDLLAA